MKEIEVQLKPKIRAAFDAELQKHVSVVTEVE
jgi:hypothetical protein